MSYATLKLSCENRKVTVNFKHDLRVNLKPKSSKTLQQTISANANIEAEKAPTDTEKVLLWNKEAKNYAEEAKHSIEEAKVTLLKKQKGF